MNILGKLTKALKTCKASEKLESSTLIEVVEEGFTKPSYLKVKNSAEGKEIIVGKCKGTVLADMSVQYLVRFEDGHEEFIFKSLKHSIG